MSDFDKILTAALSTIMEAEPAAEEKPEEPDGKSTDVDSADVSPEA